MTDSEPLLQIAQKIRDRRIEKGLTLQQVSQRSNLSKGLLSKIENSRTIPSLPVFLSLVESLDLSLKEFFQDVAFHNGKSYIHVKSSQYVQEQKEDRPGFSYRHILTQSLPSCGMETALLTIDANTTGKPTSTDGFEFKFLMNGTCHYQIGDEIIVLEEGDSLHFDASRPHRPINKSKKPVTMLVMYFLVS